MIYKRLTQYCLLALSIVSQCYALTDEPIQIQSDKAIFDQNLGKAFYRGNVSLIQGSQRLLAQELIITRTKDGKIAEFKAIGKPAKFNGSMESEHEPIHASAQTIYYFPEHGRLSLQGNAKIEFKQDIFQGPMLEYDFRKNLISANRQQDERPTIILQPKTLQQSSEKPVDRS